MDSDLTGLAECKETKGLEGPRGTYACRPGRLHAGWTRHGERCPEYGGQIAMPCLERTLSARPGLRRMPVGEVLVGVPVVPELNVS